MSVKRSNEPNAECRARSENGWEDGKIGRSEDEGQDRITKCRIKMDERMGRMIKSSLVVGRFPVTNRRRLCNFKTLDKVMPLLETGLVKKPSLETWRARGTRWRCLL